jgi:hypothetical protein
VTTRKRLKRSRGLSSRLALYATSALVIAVLFAVWSPLGQRRTGAPGQADRTASTGVTDLRQTGQARVAAAAPSPAEASLRLQALLGQHTVLAGDMMRGRLRGDPDLAQAANAALGKNTDAVGEIVGALFGDEARTKFATLWAAHVTALFNYARGLADRDDAVRAQSQSTLAGFESDLAGFFAAAAQGRLPRDAAEAAVRMHAEHLLHQADAYAQGNYTLADQIYRQAYAHAFGLGKVLASTLLPPAAATALDSPSWRLRSELDRLLGEHVVVVIAAMRAGATNAPDFSAAAETVNGNTRDLAGAMDALFGQAAARRFQSLWAGHVEALISYSAALVKHDDAARATARKHLTTYEGQLASFLGAAAGRKLSTGALAGAFKMHDDMLVREAEAFAGKDYRQAHDLAYSTYQEMFTLAGELSNAFGVTVASRLPVGGVDTGRGGMAAVVGRRWHGG